MFFSHIYFESVQVGVSVCWCACVEVGSNFIVVPHFLSVFHLATGGSGGAPLITARCDLLG